MNEKDVTDIETFWKTVKAFLSDKTATQSKVTFFENNFSVTEDKKVVATFKLFWQ